MTPQRRLALEMRIQRGVLSPTAGTQPADARQIFRAIWCSGTDPLMRR